jgi:transcriptional regulator GlxA family with amidase domain
MNDFTLIAIEGAFGTSVAATLDLVRTARLLAPVVGAPAPTLRVCSAAGGAVHFQSGLGIETCPLESGEDRSTWILPGLALNTEDEILHARERPDMRQLVAALPAHVARGGAIAAGCSAVFLLEFAGLLDCKRVTTTWWLAPVLQRMNPRCRVDAARMVCADGQIVTAGAAFAQADMMLHLLRDACGPALVDLLSRHLLVDSRDAQSPYVVPELLASGDELVTRIVARVERALPDMPSVAALAASFRMSERTLSRHVRRATGQSTMALLQSIRLRKARALLAQSRMSVEQVASAVGYGDATALRRLMRKVAGTSPRQYRPAMAAE